MTQKTRFELKDNNDSGANRINTQGSDERYNGTYRKFIQSSKGMKIHFLFEMTAIQNATKQISWLGLALVSIDYSIDCLCH